MQTTVLYMSTPEMDHDDRSSSTLRDVKRQMDRLTGEVGKLVTAIQGDDMGNEGLVPRVNQIEKMQGELRRRLDDIETEAKRRNNLIVLVVGLLAFIGGSLAKYMIDYFMPPKK